MPRRKWARLTLLCATGFALGSAPRGPLAMPAGAGPSEVLARADARVGSEGVSFSDQGRGTAPDADRTLAPYFHVAGGESEADRLPLKETSADVSIAGVIAKVKVHQLFENGGKRPIEAVYVFPASTRAAVHGMRMRIGGRTVEAKIERRAAARERYAEARKAGQRASLLEQERPNVFTMSVANVMPGERIEVELDYSELLLPEDAVYEFVYPTVVGPRYGAGADPEKDRWIANPYLRAGEPAPYRFDVKAHVETGIALKDLVSPSHTIDVKYQSASSADVRLAQAGGGNKDFVLRYRLAGDRIETGLLLWQGAKERFFLLMMEPPARPTQAQIPPREYIFLVDVSGSMHGFPLDTAKALTKTLLSQLRPEDAFNVVAFSGAGSVLAPEGSLPATPANVQRASDAVDRLRGGGGTELMGGLRLAYGVPRRGPGVSRSVVVITDGYVGVEAQAFKFVREHLSEANLFAFGIGSSVNRGLIECLARAGLGEPFVVLGPEKAREEAEKLRAYIEQPVLTGVEVRFPGFDAREVAPMKVPDLMARRPLVVFGKYQGEARGRIEVSGTTGGGRFSRTLEVSPGAARPENAALRWLWARRWVALLEDELHLARAQELEDAITDLGLSYEMLTPFTSFVAVDSEVVNRGGAPTLVNQPLPMPEGVSDLAVGGALPVMRQMSRRERAGPLVAPSPPPAPGAEAAATKARADERAEPESGASRAAAPAPSARWLVLALGSSGLGDSASLVHEVEARLRKEPAARCGAAEADVELRLTVDGAGKVVKVEILKGSGPGVDRCLEAHLAGLRSATRALDAKGGTLTLRLERKAQLPSGEAASIPSARRSSPSARASSSSVSI